MITEWRPISKPQEQFLALPDSIKEGFFGGSAGPGKSEILMMYPIVRKYYEHARFKALFTRRTYGELKGEIIPRSRQLYSAVGGKFNKSDLVWEFESGALIFFGHIEHDDDVYKYDSMEINLFLPDEIQSLTEFKYTYIAFTRVRSSIPELPAIIRAAGMPGNIGHTWVKKRFIDPEPKGGKIIIGKGGNKRIFIFSTLADNTKIDKTYAQSLESLPSEAEKRAKKYGDWNAYQGQVFDEFRERHYPDEPENALHVIEPFDIPNWWPKFVVGDWGFAAMTYIGFYAVSPTGRLYQYREIHWTKTRIEEWAPIIKDFCDKEKPRVVKFCKSAGQDRGQEHTIQQQIEAALGRSIELSNNSHGSRIAGKMLIHEYLRWKPRPQVPVDEMPSYNEEHARWVLRNKGMVEYKAYIAMFDPPQAETDIPKLQIFRCSDKEHDGHMFCCPTMIESLKACSYDKPKNNKPAEDVAEFGGDDPYDDLRYAVDTAENYFEECADEFKKLQKQENLIRQVKESNNFTMFYNQMRALENEDALQVVSRYHRR